MSRCRPAHAPLVPPLVVNSLASSKSTHGFEETQCQRVRGSSSRWGNPGALAEERHCPTEKNTLRNPSFCWLSKVLGFHRHWVCGPLGPSNLVSSGSPHLHRVLVPFAHPPLPLESLVDLARRRAWQVDLQSGISEGWPCDQSREEGELRAVALAQ